MRSGPLISMNVVVGALGIAILGAAPNAAAIADPTPQDSPMLRDGSHDFDWEIGEWTSKLRRKPPGSSTWLDYTGTTSVRPIWSGKANMVELIVHSPAGEIFKALSLRLYNPQSHQWS